MNDNLCNECIKVVDKLIKCRLSYLFDDPVTPAMEGYSEYQKIIKNPQFLKPIREKLTQNYYKNVQDWHCDMMLVFTNVQKFYGSSSFEYMISMEMQKRFQKLYAKIESKTPDGWIRTVNSYYEAISKIMLLAPNHLKTKLIDKKELEADISLKDEVLDLVQAVKILKSRNDILKILQILNSFGVNTDGNKKSVYINLKSVPNNAIAPLISYVKERYKELGLNYPS